MSIIIINKSDDEKGGSLLVTYLGNLYVTAINNYMKDRIILHSDANSFYASVELLHRPELRGKPVAVGGDPENRHGIVLTADYVAKKCGVKTGMALWQARQVCPEITFCHLVWIFI